MWSPDKANERGTTRRAGVSAAGMAETRERWWAVVCHFAAIPGFLLPPLVGMALGPLAVWLWKRGESSFIEEHGREALNFQLSVLLYLLVTIPIGGFYRPLSLVPFALSVFDVVCVLLACNKAHDGKTYSYPLSIEFII